MGCRRAPRGDGHKAVLLKERRKNAMVRPGKGGLRSGQVRSDQTHLLSRDECWNLGRFHVEERYHNGILITPFLDAQRGHLHRFTDRDPPLQENGSDVLEDTPVSTNCRVVSGSVVSGFGSYPLLSSLFLTCPKPEVLDRVESRKCGPLRQERTIANHSNDGFSLLALRAP